MIFLNDTSDISPCTDLNAVTEKRHNCFDFKCIFNTLYKNLKALIVFKYIYT